MMGRKRWTWRRCTKKNSKMSVWRGRGGVWCCEWRTRKKNATDLCVLCTLQIYPQPNVCGGADEVVDGGPKVPSDLINACPGVFKIVVENNDAEEWRWWQMED